MNRAAKALAFIGLAAAALFAAAAIFVAAKSPFTPERVKQSLGKKLGGTVQFRTSHTRYVPRPRFVAEDVVIRSSGRVITARRLAVAATYAGLFRSPKHIASIQADGVQADVVRGASSSGGASASHGGQQNSSVVVDNITIQNGVLHISNGNSVPLQFDIHSLSLGPLGGTGRASFGAAMTNPKPRAELNVQGTFGPIPPDRTATPISGSYVLLNADLHSFRSMAGELSSKGTFKGPLNAIEVEGETESPNFEVVSSGHSMNLRTRFSAVVNGTNGDVTLHPVNADFEHTTLAANGAVKGHAGQHGKTLRLAIAERHGRIEDLLRIFVKSKPPMQGAVAFRATAVLPPEKEKFVKKVIFIADFGIDDADFTHHSTQHGVNVLSARARGEKNRDDDPQRVIENLHGHVELRHGVATFSRLAFDVPGASALLSGTYNLVTERVNLHGTLRTAATLSEETKGVKSVFLKLLDPFFERRHAGAAIPVSITGTYDHPVYAALGAKKGG